MPMLAALCTSLAIFTGVAGARHFDRLTLPRWIAPLCAVTLGILAAQLIQRDQSPLWLGATSILFILLAAIATIDAVTETIPDVLSMTLTGAGLLYSYATGTPPLALGLLAGAFILIAVLRDWLFDDTGAIGSGDLILVAGVIAWVGPLLLIDVLLIAAVVGIIQLPFTRRTTLPFAPAITFGLGAVWLGGPLF